MQLKLEVALLASCDEGREGAGQHNVGRGQV